MTTPTPPTENNHNVDVIELLLQNGANLNTRTVWGDTAVHYAARHGTFDVLQYLCEEGITVSKPKSKFFKTATKSTRRK